MSGGYFDYSLANVAESMEGRWADEEMNALFSDLFCNGEFSVRGYGGLAQSLDFWLSDDTSEEDYREAVALFKKKWFNRSPEDRAEFYRKQLQKWADQYKMELGNG